MLERECEKDSVCERARESVWERRREREVIKGFCKKNTNLTFCEK